jgi:Activator of Hsp90 ATPase homolog 1-like protein
VDEGSVLRVELHDHGAKTRMTLTDGPFPPEGRAHAESGWSQAFAKLVALLAR